MKNQFNRQTLIVGLLGMLATAAVFALLLTYFAYLPTITSIPLQRSDAWLRDEFYRIARNSFLISVASGLVLGFAVPVIFRVFRDRYGTHAG